MDAIITSKTKRETFYQKLRTSKIDGMNTVGIYTVQLQANNR